MSEYLILDSDLGPYDCALTEIRGLDNTFPLTSGQSVQESFPGDATFSMCPDFPNGIRTPDSLNNINMLFVASNKLVNYFREATVPDVEYLRVTILDHRGKAIKSPYFIIHPIQAIKALDLEGADVKYSSVLPDQIRRLNKIKLSEELIPPSTLIFRCANLADFIFVRRSFANQVSQTGFTGIIWRELADCSL